MQSEPIQVAGRVPPEPYYRDEWLTVWLGDCREVMAAMEPESVHCVVTSPPYWGLRDYGTATWEGGDAACDHVQGPLASSSSTLAGYTSDNIKLRTNGVPFKGACGKCGATRVDSQLGLEPTPELFVEAMVAVFREVRRVLRKDGTVWLNLGDSYAGGGTAPQGLTGQMASRAVVSSRANRRRNGLTGGTRTVDVSLGGSAAPGLKPKDLVGIPWRVAFALQADGWYLRSDIIWSKPNPMPESVTDRPTKAHEYVFLLSKSARYFYDADAVREAAEYGYQSGRTAWVSGQQNGDGHRSGGTGAAIRNPETGRNLRSVWNIATEPYPGAHFATFPRALVEPCIKAGTSEKGVCPECGAPWARIVERTIDSTWEERKAAGARGGNGLQAARENGARHQVPVKGSGVSSTFLGAGNQTTGWRPSCTHGRDPIPATCLDPFAGSGTTGLVAQSLSRRAVLIDLSADYLEQLMDRNRDIPLGLAGG